jgi:hypothetical protein
MHIDRASNRVQRLADFYYLLTHVLGFCVNVYLVMTRKLMALLCTGANVFVFGTTTEALEKGIANLHPTHPRSRAYTGIAQRPEPGSSLNPTSREEGEDLRAAAAAATSGDPVAETTQNVREGIKEPRNYDPHDQGATQPTLSAEAVACDTARGYEDGATHNQEGAKPSPPVLTTFMTQSNLGSTPQHDSLEEASQPENLEETSQHDSLEEASQPENLEETSQHDSLEETSQHDSLEEASQHDSLEEASQPKTILARLTNALSNSISQIKSAISRCVATITDLIYCCKCCAPSWLSAKDKKNN